MEKHRETQSCQSLDTGRQLQEQLDQGVGETAGRKDKVPIPTAGRNPEDDQNEQEETPREKRRRTAKYEMPLGIVFDSPDKALAPWQGAYMESTQQTRFKLLKAMQADLNLATVGPYGLVEHPDLDRYVKPEEVKDFNWEGMTKLQEESVREFYQKKANTVWWETSIKTVGGLLSSGRRDRDAVARALMKDMEGPIQSSSILRIAMKIFDSQEPELLLRNPKSCESEWKGFRISDLITALNNCAREQCALDGTEDLLAIASVTGNNLARALGTKKWKVAKAQLKSVVVDLTLIWELPALVDKILKHHEDILDVVWCDLEEKFGCYAEPWEFMGIKQERRTPGGALIINDVDIVVIEDNETSGESDEDGGPDEQIIE